MKVLAIDTSTMAASCAIGDENKIIGELFTDYKLKHSEKLLPIIDHILKDTKTSLDDIDCLAVGKGPGSFTGLRIAFSTLKGIAMAKNLKISTVSSLEAVAFTNRNFTGNIFVVFDGGKEDVYFGAYSSKNNTIEEKIAPKVEKTKNVIALANEKGNVLFAGDGIFRNKEAFINEVKNITFAPKELLLPRASSILLLAMQKNNFRCSRDVMPEYIKSFEVQVGRGRK